MERDRKIVLTRDATAKVAPGRGVSDKDAAADDDTVDERAKTRQGRIRELERRGR